MSVDNLSYLTVAQHLADVANFIYQMNGKYGFTSNQKWILFGGSYAGALVTWLVKFYPHLAYGAVSSSGTVNATIDFIEFYTRVSDIYRQQSDNCANEITTGFNALQRMLQNVTVQPQLESILS